MQEVLENNKRYYAKSKRVNNIDFNCDLAQGFGVYKNEQENEFLENVSSVNVSSGLFAGDPANIKDAFLMAKKQNAVVGVNIGYNDRQGFGLRAMELQDDEIEPLVIYQVSALMAFAKAYGVEVEFVRPHGAMYIKASQDFEFSCKIAQAVKKCSKWLSYVGAAGEVLNNVQDSVQIATVKEFNLIKNYNNDLTIDYSLPDIQDSEKLSRRLHKFLQYSQIENVNHGSTYIEADTLHFSSDPASLKMLKEAAAMITPLPVNYSRVKNSGWV